MSVRNTNGERVSYECSELIEELKEDIKEFGENEVVIVWCTMMHGVVIYTNYDFVDEDTPVTEAELTEKEIITKMTMKELLILLEKQNEII